MTTTNQTQVRFDSRSTASAPSTGRRSRKMSPCTVTNADGTTVVYDKKTNNKKGA